MNNMSENSKKVFGVATVARLWVRVQQLVITKIKALTKTDVGLGNVTNDAQVKRSEMGVSGGVATLGTDGKVPKAQLPELDLSLFKAVEALPTTDIKVDKIYLVRDEAGNGSNKYKEYMYLGDPTAAYDPDKWEIMGEFKSDVDLTEYMKRSDLNNYLTQDNIHVRRQVQDDYGSVQYAGINLNGQKASLECSFDQDGGNEGKAKIDLNGDGTLKIESTPDVGGKTASIYTEFPSGAEYVGIKIKSEIQDGSNSSIGVGEDVDIYSQGNINIHGGGGSECQINAGNGIFLTSSEVNFSRVSSLTGIKTINGQSILGEGNILEEMTEAELDEILNNNMVEGFLPGDTEWDGDAA